MAKTHSKPGQRLHQTKILNPATTQTPPENEAPWQQLMVLNYVLFEAIDAMEQERAASRHTPLNQSWQQFAHLLRQRKPKLGACLDSLLDNGLLDRAPQQAGRPL